MNSVEITLLGVRLHCLGSGALWWPEQRLLVVADLHLGKSERMARRGGAILPPYETRDTLARLAAEVAARHPDTVLCLGDSFDDSRCESALDPADAEMLALMQHGRRWIWVTGNHDPAPVRSGGISVDALPLDPLLFRHIATPGGRGEISAHYHPKASLAVRGRLVRRPCFLHDARRLILPAYGTYTGGLDWCDAAFAALFGPGAVAVLTGAAPHAVPVPRIARAG